MMTLAPARQSVKASVVLFSPAIARRLHNASFGRGVIVERPATDSEYRQHFEASTFSREEKAIADRFNLDLAEARALLAEGAEVLESAEWDRLAAWDDVNAAEAESDEDAMLADMARRYDAAAAAGAFGPEPIDPPKPRGWAVRQADEYLEAWEACQALIKATCPRKPRRVDAAKARRIAARA